MKYSKQKKVNMFTAAILIITIMISFLPAVFVAGKIIENINATQEIFHDFLRSYKHDEASRVAAALYPEGSEEFQELTFLYSQKPLPYLVEFGNAVDYSYHRLWRRGKKERASAVIEYIDIQGKTRYKTLDLDFEKKDGSWFLTSVLFSYGNQALLPPLEEEEDLIVEKEDLVLDDAQITHYDIKKTDELHHYSFEGATNLLSLSFPAELSEFNPFWFSNNKKLYHIDIAPDSPYFTSMDGVVYNKDMTELIYYPCGKINAQDQDTGEFTPPDTVQIIGRNAFFNSAGVKKIVLPSSVKEIQQSAFNSSANLEEIVLNDGLLKIEREAFLFSARLSSISIPASVQEIGEDCFFNCSWLTSVDFAPQSSLQSLGAGAFSQCGRLSQINLPDSLERIENWTFENCSSLEVFSLPNNLNYIGVAAFENCSIQELTIGKDITTIKRLAFKGCASLQLCIEFSQKPSGWDDDWDFGLPKEPFWSCSD